MLFAMRSMVDRSSPLSVVRDLATSRTTLKTRLGWESRLVDLSFCMTAARKYCWRWMRWVSEPSPTFSRSRTNASAWAPLTTCFPADRCSRDWGLLIANGRQTGTPPTSLTIDWKPAKFTSTKCWMRMPVSCSSVFHRHGAPPAENVAFSRSSVPGLRALARVALLVVGAGQNRNHRVAREADDVGPGVPRGDVQQHRGVRAGAEDVRPELACPAPAANPSR